MADEKSGNASIWKLDPAGGSSYVQIINQLDGTLIHDMDTLESTSKSSSQNRTYEIGNTGWSGTISGRTTTDPALDLDGSSEYAHVADDADFDLTTAITIEVVITPDAVSGTQFIAHKTDGTDGYSLSLEGNEVKLLIENTGSTDGSEQTDSLDLVAGEQHTIKAIFLGSGPAITFYVDGTLEASSSSGTIPAVCGVNSTRLTIGADAAGANNFDGKFYTAVVSDSSTDNGQRILSSNSQGYWRFNGDLTDESGNSHTLTGVSIDATDYGDLTLAKLQQLWEDKESLTFQFLEDGTADTYTGTGIVSNLTRTYPQNGIAEWTVNIQGTSAQTIV